MLQDDSSTENTEAITDAKSDAPAARVNLLGVEMPDRIPRLPMWLARAVQAIFALAVITILVSIPIASLPKEREEQQAALAIHLTGVDEIGRHENGLRIAPLAPAARQAGVRTGDIVTAVDGKPLNGDLVADGPLFVGPEGSMARLDIRHEDGSTFTVELLRSKAYIEQAYVGSGLTYQLRRWFDFWSTTIYSTFLTMVGAILLFRYPREPVVAILAMGWSIPDIPFSLLGLPEWMDLVSAAVMYTCVPLGISLFPDSRFASRWNWVLLAYIPVFLLLWLLSLNSSNPAMIYYPTVLTMFSLLGITVVTRYRRTPPGTQRQQLKFFTLGLVILALCMIAMALTGVTTSSVVVDGGALGWRTVIVMTLIATGFTSLGIGILISLLRYRLYDADRTISRSVAIGALTLALVAIFAGSEKMAEVLGEEWFGRDIGAVAGGLGAAVAAVFIAPLHKRLDGWAERWFQSDLTHLRSDLPELIGDWRETMTPAELGHAVLAKVVPTVRAQSGAVILSGEPVATEAVDDIATKAWMAEHDSEPKKPLEQDIGAAPFTTRLSLEAAGHGRIGWLLLGPRPDGSALGKDEREALIAIADPLARALQVASERAERHRASEARIGQLEQAVTQLRTSILDLSGQARWQAT